MSRHPRLSLIRNSYYFRARLPVRLRRALRISEIRVNLKTDSRREAVNRAGLYHFLFEQMTGHMTDSEQLHILEQDIARGEAEFDEKSSQLKTAETQLKQLISWIKNINAEQITSIRLQEYANFVKHHLNASLMESEGIKSTEVRALVHSMRLAMEYLEPDDETDRQTPLDEGELIAYKRKFKSEFMQLWQKQVQKIKANRVPESTHVFTTPHQVNLMSLPTPTPTKHLSFLQLHEEELDSELVKSLKRQNSTNGEYYRYAEKFDVLLDGLSVCELTVDRIKNLYKDLLTLKKSTGTTKRYTTRDDLITSDPGKTLALETIVKHTIRLNTLLAFAKQKNYINIDLQSVDKASLGSLITAKQKTQKHDDEDNAAPFTEDEIAKIFNSYLYNKDKSRNVRAVHPYQYFFPFLGAFTGCRINELAQLDTDDIVIENPCSYIKIEGDIDSNVPGARSLKNEPSKRKVPIHPKLIEIGFLDYVEQRKASKEKKLWDGLRWAEKGHYGALATQFFCRLDGPGGYLHHLGIHLKANDNKNFHSFRHTLITKLRNEAIVGLDAKNTDALIESITGHASKNKTTADDYGHHTLTRKLEVISKISYKFDIDVMSYQAFYERYRSLIKHGATKFKQKKRKRLLPQPSTVQKQANNAETQRQQ